MTINIPDKVLLQVEKPARYIGNEVNMVEKNPEDVSIRFGLCYPDVYEVGMSHLGSQILYTFLNNREDTYCERVYAPWHDMEEQMRTNEIPLYTLETATAIKDLDFFGVTLQYEMSYTNILNVLDLGGIPIYSKDRDENHPLVVAGGPCAYNPEPLADFIDFFYIGEGEVIYNEIMEAYKTHKENGGTREGFLEKLLDFQGIYVPKFYDVTYKENGEIESFKPNHENAPSKIMKLAMTDMNMAPYPTKPIVPYIQTVHDRAVVELFRGCIRGCRFCQAGMIYRPVREKSADKVCHLVDEMLKSTGFDEVSLISLSSSDYTHLTEVTKHILENHEHVNISLPSLRVDEFALNLMEDLSKGRKSTLTFAPEAGSQKMRDVINKGLTEEQIMEGVSLALQGGWDKIKLYFMLGLPLENNDDIEGIAELAYKMVDQYFAIDKEKRSRNLKITVSTSFFVPKPFTPFQWSKQNTYEEFMEKQSFLSSKIRHRKIQYNCHDAKLSALEGVIARGDRKVGGLIYRAWELGCKFDGWSEYFDYDKWMQAANDIDFDETFYNNRQRSFDEILPWDHIDTGVTKEFLYEQYQEGEKQVVTPHCRAKCSSCGVNKLDFGQKGVCYEKKN